jgi:hypothetical protein
MRPGIGVLQYADDGIYFGNNLPEKILVRTPEMKESMIEFNETKSS